MVISLFVCRSALANQEMGGALTENFRNLSLARNQMDRNIFADAEAYQNHADQCLSQGHYKEAAENYISSLETVFDNYDLHCFLKRVGFNYKQIPDTRNDPQARESLIQELEEKLKGF